MANLIRRENPDVAPATRREWDPFRMLDVLLRLDPFRSERGWLSEAAEFAPRFDVKETKDAYLIKADLPGLADKDVEISVTGNVLTVSGQREDERQDEGDRYYMTERSYGRFTRSLSLPDGADAENVKADLKDGVLSVKVPKRPEVQPKKISVGTGASGSEGKAEGKAKA